MLDSEQSEESIEIDQDIKNFDSTLPFKRIYILWKTSKFLEKYLSNNRYQKTDKRLLKGLFTKHVKNPEKMLNQNTEIVTTVRDYWLFRGNK